MSWIVYDSSAVDSGIIVIEDQTFVSQAHNSEYLNHFKIKGQAASIFFSCIKE
jgi:hypothetical protein